MCSFNFYLRGGFIELIIIVGVLLFFIAIVFIMVSKKGKKEVNKIKNKYNIQQGRIAYSDLNKPARPFFSKRYRISGKPDYIIKRNDKYIPVELKTGYHPAPLKNHVFQLAAYCHLLEENYGGFVPYGVLVYNNEKQFKIPFDPNIRFELENTIKKMRCSLENNRFSRNHNDLSRCLSCSMRKYCNIKLS